MARNKLEDGSRGDDQYGFGEQPRVVVRFRESVELPYRPGAEEMVDEKRIGPWRRLEERYGDLGLQPLITSLDPGQLDELVEQARRTDPTYRPAKFTAFFWVEAPADADLDALAAELSKWPSVETAYVDRPGPDPVVNALDDPRAVNQGYLNPAPDGIDARYAWGVPGGDGEGQRLVDVEQGWTLDHEDLVAQGATLLHGVLLNSSRNHGTSVLGEICAVDNAVGCVGITPKLADVAVSSFNGSTRPDAVIAALPLLEFGDVLLIEAQVVATGSILGPIEVLDADYEALRLATALGVIVVEAGGNGTDNGAPPALNLDTYANAAGRRILDPSSPDFRDSGAIIVTAATSAAPHTRLAYAPHGRRIDCYGWGQNIATCASTPAGSITAYRSDFGGTSGASPIIAGAALAVQGILEKEHGFRLGPRQMRRLLSNPATGTPRAATEPTAIGVLPNLRAIIDNALDVAPDVYQRDYVGDSGEPHTGPVASSPDLIVVPAPGPANPQAAYGAGSGTEGSAALTGPLVAGDHVVFARVLNQGGAATSATVNVYWSPPATLVTPNLWTSIGATVLPNVPTGEVLTVGPGISWPAAALPAAGHYCLVGIVGSAQDPAPTPADFLVWDNFIRFIRENNNVTWRNFNVVPAGPNVNDPSVPRGFQAFDFLVPGAPDLARPMGLHVGAKLPARSRLILEVPLHLLEILRLREGKYEVDEKRRVALIAVPTRGWHAIGVADLPAASTYDVRLLVRLGKTEPGASYDVTVRQVWEDVEVGRLTWRLVTPGREGDD